MAATENVRGLIDELLALGRETEWVEFKRNWDKPDDIGEYVSALANSAARVGKAQGYIVWGVDDVTHELAGTAFDPYRSKVGNEELENWLVRSLTPRIDLRFIVAELDAGRVVLLEVPRAVNAPVQFKKQEYIRVGTIRQPLKDHPQIERELWRIFDQTPFERLVAMQDVSDGEVLRRLDVPGYYELLDRPFPDDHTTMLEQLVAESMIARSDRGGWDITNLGAVLLARKLSDFTGLQRKAVRVVSYQGTDRVHTLQEQEGTKGYAIGFEGLIAYVEDHLPHHESVAALRTTTRMYPTVAIRELVANALIHQDFSITGAGPLIEIFDGRVEITNPGAPLVDTERMLDVPPRSRNESLASFMRRAGICEERGSGVDKVVFETEIAQLPAPDFRVAGDNMISTLFGPRPLAEMDKADRIRAVYLHACLRYVSRQDVTNTTVRERFGITDKSKASRLIAEAIDAERIKPRDPDAGRRYAQYVPFWA